MPEETLRPNVKVLSIEEGDSPHPMTFPREDEDPPPPHCKVTLMVSPQVAERLTPGRFYRFLIGIGEAIQQRW